MIIFCFNSSATFAIERIIDLNIGYKTVYFAGKAVKAISVNNQIPAPTLHFKEGDHVTINVYNHLNEETALHWHGMILPWQMDGVLGVTQEGIPPGGVFHYKFILNQSGTYWYHAHAGLQEQQGLYGAFLIDPLEKPAYHYSKDYVVVLSDWSNTHPDQILANLKKEGDYYSPRFPLQPSLVKFVHDYQKASAEERQKIVSDYKMMQQMRMSIYDFSDVAYDAFLLNGHSNPAPWRAPVRVGDVVRLRFIGAGASTIFRVKIPDTSMQVVHVEGNDVTPYTVEDFKIAPGETYDVLVRIRKSMPSIIYAESIDTLGAAYGALVTTPQQTVNYKDVPPFPAPVPVMREMMSLMMDDMMHPTMNMGHNMPMNHTMSMQTEPTIIGDVLSAPTDIKKTTGTKYQQLSAAVITNNPNKPVEGVFKMELFGYMDRYIWFINGVPEHKAHPIPLKPNKRYRFVFTNPTMMRHPMHIHGHWFILRNGHGRYDPLLHTLDIPPGATVTADLDTDASGQWLFHCHLLYHMMSGMSRVFQYSTLIQIMEGKAKPEDIIKNTPYKNRPIVRVDETRPIKPALVHHPMAHQTGIWRSTLLDIGADPFHNVQRLSYKGLYGPDYNKLELFTNDAEVTKGNVDNADIDIFYWHLINQFWAIKGGINYFNQPANKPYWQPGLGIEGMMPYFIDTNIRSYSYSGSVKLDIELSRDSQITNNFLIRTGIRGILASKTVTRAEIGSGLNQMRYIVRPYYRLAPGLNIFFEYEHEQDYGSFKTMLINSNDPINQNTFSFGLSALL
jgi:FtsP/CotA-like multicopper oxidase with cupredoxin domain